MSQASNMSYASNSSNSSNTSHTSSTPPPPSRIRLYPAPAGVRLTCGKKERNEKNWIPFSVDIGTYFVYSISPHVVLTGRPGDGLCVKSYSTTAFKPINELAEKVGAQYIRGVQLLSVLVLIAFLHYTAKLEKGQGHVYTCFQRLSTRKSWQFRDLSLSADGARPS